MTKRYREYSPTGFDTKGLNATTMGEDDGDRSEWLVAPIGRNRDNEHEPTVASNWATLIKDLDKEEIQYETHSFNHWACGWFEIVIVEPTEKGEKWCEEWEGALSDYPIADDSDHSERELEAQWQSWISHDFRWLVKWTQKEFELKDDTATFLENEGAGVFHEALICGHHARQTGIYDWLQYEGTDLPHNFGYYLKDLNRRQLAWLINQVRAEVRKKKAEKLAAQAEPQPAKEEP